MTFTIIQGDGKEYIPGEVVGVEAVEHSDRHRAFRWFSWIFGLAILVVVIVAALHFSEGKDLVRIAERAQPWWVTIAIVLQAATYLAQGETWRVVTRAAGVEAPLLVTYKLSLAKLFIDQALPSGGISGTVVVARVLEQRGASRTVVVAAVVVSTVSYYGATLLALALALIIVAVQGHVDTPIIAAALLFMVLSGLLIAAPLILSGRKSAGSKWVGRIPLLKNALAILGEADPKLARNLHLLIKSGLYQLAIVLLDTSTLWILIRSLGDVASPTGVFTAFMVSNLLRTISIVPGGLGVFDAALVVALKLAGVLLPVALGATILFRALSFWLPMIPGLIFSHGARKTIAKSVN